MSKILKLQNQTIAELLEAARAHNTALRKNDIKLILATAYKQEEISRKLIDQDKRREATQKKLADKYGLGGQPTLNMLLSHASEITARELDKLSRSLKASLTQVDEMKNLNNILARRGLIMTEQLMRILRPKSGSTYMGSGKMKDRGKLLSVLDRTI
ncbi:flagellar protein FlgN [Pelotomaculum propionicicum]|uniref:flagellar protein FlgN n=1 Tax=Pelotomaculum propionicicum TaxID=258475 RepID=UPI003B7F7915